MITNGSPTRLCHSLPLYSCRIQHTERSPPNENTDQSHCQAVTRSTHPRHFHSRQSTILAIPCHNNVSGSLATCSSTTCAVSDVHEKVANCRQWLSEDRQLETDRRLAARTSLSACLCHSRAGWIGSVKLLPSDEKKKREREKEGGAFRVCLGILILLDSLN